LAAEETARGRREQRAFLEGSATSSLVASNGDGSFSPDDDAYTLVWQSGIHLTRTEHADRTVYELATDLTSPDAELIRESDTGGVSEASSPCPSG
jgi:hypothetical protein